VARVRREGGWDEEKEARKEENMQLVTT